MVAGGADVSLSAVNSWSTGRTFPAPENLAHLAAALERLAERTRALAPRVASAERPATLSAGKRGAGKRGRPPKPEQQPDPSAAPKRRSRPRPAPPE